MNKLNEVMQERKLSLGLVFPLEAYSGSIPRMENQETLAKRAEQLGFSALWFRDVPFNDPSFGDAGQQFDTWVYMTHIMNHTKQIALASGSVILPLRHPVHTAKSVASLQALSDGRVILGIASGDRPIEYPAFAQNIDNRSELFRDNFFYLKALFETYPSYESKYFGRLFGNIDLLPKHKYQTSYLVTGHSGQDLEWIAKYSDGWLYYPRDFKALPIIMNRWRKALSATKQGWKPFAQSLYVDLLPDKHTGPSPIHLGFKAGLDYTLAHLKQLESSGVNHVILNLKFSSRPIEVVIEELGELVLPHFK